MRHRPTDLVTIRLGTEVLVTKVMIAQTGGDALGMV
jgi:hypothetical protein